MEFYSLQVGRNIMPYLSLSSVCTRRFIHYFGSMDTEAVMQNVQSAYAMKNPSDVVFLMSRNSYLEMLNIKRKNRIQYLRISKKPFYSFAQFWNPSIYSLLIEPMAHAILIIKVSFAERPVAFFP